MRGGHSIMDRSRLSVSGASRAGAAPVSCTASAQTHTRGGGMSLHLILMLGALASAHAWGGLFNRFSSDMLANMGYGHASDGGYRQYPYGQVEPEELYEEMDTAGNRLDNVIDEVAQCYKAPCLSSGDCCQGFVCLNSGEARGYCHLPTALGRKIGEMCNRDNQCEAGLICEEVVPGEMLICRPPTPGRNQYNADCNLSKDCDITRGLCCVMQRRHRQKPRKSCGYFKNPIICIGPVATDQVRGYVEHTAGEKRIGVYHLH